MTSLPLFQALLGASLLALPVSHAATTDETAPPSLPGGWVYTWGDEFNGTQLDPAKWGYELGVVRNKGESQTYTKEAAEVKDGKLIITTTAQETPCCSFRQQATRWQESIRTQPYASASVTTNGIMSFKPGCRLEVRARIPSAKGSWPAIWMRHENGREWPARGETDLLEHISQDKDVCYSTFHWGSGGTMKHTSKGKATRIPGLTHNWHVYSLEWTDEEMIIRVDDKETARFRLDTANYPDGSNPFRHPAHLILNTAVGGSGTWAEKPDATQYPCRFEIDYVRYYTLTSKEGKAPENPGQ